MSIKTLKLKKVFVHSIYRSLKGIPPKDYPTTGEIKTTISDILPAFKPHLSEYIKMSDSVDEVIAQKLPEKELKVKMDEINKNFADYNKEHGNDIVEITLDGEAFKTLKSQFDREGWGKTWMSNLDEFMELENAFEVGSKSDEEVKKEKGK